MREARLPSYDDRRAMMARDPLASVDGFRTICLLAIRHLFGIRVCSRCPDCSNSSNPGATPCQDVFGSNATPEGGIFGRVDGIVMFIEAQKSAGSYMRIRSCSFNAYTNTHRCWTSLRISMAATPNWSRSISNTKKARVPRSLPRCRRMAKQTSGPRRGMA